MPVYGAGEGELLTPTGALLVTAHATAYGPLPAAAARGGGPRRGHARHARPAQRAAPDRGRARTRAAAGERVLVLEAEIDDMSPQLCGPLMDRLLAAGALDAYLTPVQMKKGRPGLAGHRASREPARREALEEVLFAETTTLGVRRQEWDRTVLDRERGAGARRRTAPWA